MPPDCLIRIGSQKGSLPFNSSLNPLRNQILKFPKTKFLFLRMVHQSGSTKRPTCPSCSKPALICLCNRLKTPALQNSVSVTILQHSLEKKHPLNSARIATLGLKKVDVITVSDVNFQARFIIWLLDSCGRMGRVESDETSKVFDEMPREGETNDCVDGSILENSELGTRVIDFDGQFSERSYFDGAKMHQIRKNNTILSLNSDFLMNRSIKSELESCGGEVASRNCSLDEAMLYENSKDVANEVVETCFDANVAALRGSEATAICFTIEKYGAISSFDQNWTATNKLRKMNLDQLLDSDVAVDFIIKGFVVKKLQRKPVDGSCKYEESEEFDIAVPPGSVLLFPIEKSIDVEAINFEVKNLIVLDGTWAKAKRMYKENPWLKLLPHIRLDLDKLSLYGEVRHQPKEGYLSTIESIVYALKSVGEDSEGLDGLLDVFESMVGHQRQCKDERLSRHSEF